MASQVRYIAGELSRFTEKKVRELALAVTANLVERTPVDTGWARSNWIPRIGSPVDGPSGSRESVSSAEQAAGQAGLIRYKLEEGTVFVSNAVPYIRKLAFGGYPPPGTRITETVFGEVASPSGRKNKEPKVTSSGFSTQAPNGFVEQAIAAALKEVQ